MKKLISITILFVMVALLATSVVNAAVIAKEDLADELYKIGEKYGLTQSDKVKIERLVKLYVKDNTQSEAIYSKALDAQAILDEAGVKSIEDLEALPSDKKSALVSIATKAGAEVGLDVTFKDGKLYMSKDGELVEVIGIDDGKLVYTGNNVNAILVVSSVAVIALATVFVAKRKMANA